MERADPSGSRAVLFCNFSDRDRAFGLGSEWDLALSTSPQTGGPCSASLYLANPGIFNPT
jgi:hypothetical protein